MLITGIALDTDLLRKKSCEIDLDRLAFKYFTKIIKLEGKGDPRSPLPPYSASYSVNYLVEGYYNGQYIFFHTPFD
jgi:hypothetical protein